MRYTDFDIVVSEITSDDWTVRAEWRDGNASGEAEGRVTVDRSQLERDLDRLATATPMRARALPGQRRPTSVDADFLEAFGRRLFAMLFGETRTSLLEELNQCWGRTKGDRGHSIRIRLRLSVGEAALVPWEFLFWPSQNDFMATDPSKSLVRRVKSSGTTAIETTSVVRILVVAPPVSDLDSSTEVRNLRRTFDPLSPGIEYEVLGVQGDDDDTMEPVFRDTIRTRLRESGPFHLVHYIGHGTRDDVGAALILNEPELTEPSSKGDRKPANGGWATETVDHAQFARLIRAEPSVSLVVLNSCEGATVSDDEPFIGMAQQLVRMGVPAVVAMQFTIRDQVAIRFASSFYQTLVSDRYRGDVEAAMAQARNDLAIEFPQTRALGTPALFLHGEHGILFDFDRGRILADRPRSPDAVDRLRTVAHTKALGIAALREEGSGDASELTQRLEIELAALRRIRQRLQTGSLFAAIPILAALIVFASYWMSAFDRSSLWFDAVTAQVAEVVFDVSDPSSTLVVGIDSADYSREALADLVIKLTDADAAVVAIDMYFSRTTAADSSLRAAFEHAQERGTPVIVASNSLTVGDDPYIVGSLEGAANVAASCGTTRPTAVLDLVIKSSDGGRTLPSLPLAAALAFRQETLTRVDPDLRQLGTASATAGAGRSISFASWERARSDQGGCPLIKEGDSIARLVIDYTYAEETGEPPAVMGLPELDERLAVGDTAIRNKIVLVGRTDEARWPLYARIGERRYGFEIVASAIDTLLADRVIRRISGTGLFLLLVGTGLLGSVIAVYPRRTTDWVRWSVLVTAALLLLAIGAVAYLGGLIIIFVYPVLALVIGYWSMRRALRWRLV